VNPWPKVGPGYQEVESSGHEGTPAKGRRDQATLAPLVAAWALFVFVFAVNHIFAHLGDRLVPIGMGTQDLVIGEPMAGLILLAGLIIIDPREPKATNRGQGRRK